MKIIFMGTPDFAVPALNALVEARHEIVAAYSQPPRPANRGKQLTPSPVHARAEALGIPVYTPESLRGDTEKAEFANHEADIAIVAAYGLILPKAVLEAPVHGCLNIHASLLPRWRGAAPVQRAILAGDEKTGVTIMRMEKGLDTGPMLAEITTRIDDKNAGQLTEELSLLGGKLMVEVLNDLSLYPEQPQPEGATYAPKIDKPEAHIDFTNPAIEIERQIRAFAPAPGAWFEHQGERFRILAADATDENGAAGEVLDENLAIACGEGAIRPTLIQRAGKAAMTPDDLLRGYRLPSGTILS